MITTATLHTAREAEIAAFLTGFEWSDAARAKLSGDASTRRYERLTRRTGETAILMVVPVPAAPVIDPFVRVAEHLRSLGFSAPEIYGQNTDHGLLLLEDFGNALFFDLVTADPTREEMLYAAAIDVLAALAQHRPPKWAQVFTPAIMTEQASLATVWYGSRTNPTASKDDHRALLDALEAALSQHAAQATILSMRDMHAQNLIWLPDREGLSRVGLLDFQDAVATHPAYELVSLLQDARRDLGEGIEHRMIDRYLAHSDQDRDAFLAAYATLGVQRALRILGIFARLCLRDDKPAYVDLAPRVWGHLMRNLSSPALSDLRNTVMVSLPPPDRALRDAIKQRAGTCPTL